MASGIPLVSLTFEVRNTTDRPLDVSVAGTLPNFVGVSTWNTRRDWKGDQQIGGAKGNRNRHRTGAGFEGLYMDSAGVDGAVAARMTPL